MDALITSIDDLGRSQKIYLFFIGMVTSIAALNFYSSVFFTAEPSLICKISNKYNNLTLDQNLNMEKCLMWNNYSKSKVLGLKSPYECEFKDERYNLTIVNEWELICDKEYLIGISQNIFLFGSISAVFNGFLSDRLGRKRSCIILILLMFIFTLIYQILITDSFLISLNTYNKFLVYCFYQFVKGLLIYCLFAVVYILAFEFTTDKHHTLITNVLITFYVLGELIILLAFYLTRNWRYTSWFISLYFTIFSLAFVLVIPESPRWLVEMNRFDEAFSIIKKMAKINKSKVQLNINEIKQFKSEKNYIQDDEEESTGIVQALCCSKTNLFYLCALFIIWNALSLNYVGVSLGLLSSLNINPFLIFFLSSKFELIGAWLSYIGEYIGTKTALFISFLIVSISSIFVSFLPDDQEGFEINYFLYIKLCLLLLGRCMLSTAYNLSFIYTARLFDVKVRSTVILLLGSLGCSSSLVTPQINLLKSTWKPLPYFVYSLSSFISCIFLFFLPAKGKNKKIEN